MKRFCLRWRYLSIGKFQADWGGQDPGVRYLQVVKYQWKGNNFAMNKKEHYFFFFLCGRGKRRGEQRREWQGWKELGRLIKLVKAMDAPQRWIPWHLVFSGKSFVFLHLWFVILLSSSCSKISMKIYELWNISCFMWEKFVKVRERSTLGDEGFAEILGGILWISTGYDFGGFQGLALFDIKAVLTLQ